MNSNEVDQEKSTYLGFDLSTQKVCCFTILLLLKESIIWYVFKYLYRCVRMYVHNFSQRLKEWMASSKIVLTTFCLYQYFNQLVFILGGYLFTVSDVWILYKYVHTYLQMLIIF